MIERKGDFVATFGVNNTPIHRAQSIYLFSSGWVSSSVVNK